VQHSPGVNPAFRPDRPQLVLGLLSALCYAIGYPVALIANSPFGWVLVTLGGFLLFALIFMTVRRIERNRDSTK